MRTAEVTDQSGDFQAVVDVGLAGVLADLIAVGARREPVADKNVAKLKDLAHAADVLAYEGVVVNAALLKRKFANGRTLLQVAQAGESAREAANQLVRIYKREAAQRERIAAQFANRTKTPSSADFDLPSANDLA